MSGIRKKGTQKSTCSLLANFFSDLLAFSRPRSLGRLTIRPNRLQLDANFEFAYSKLKAAFLLLANDKGLVEKKCIVFKTKHAKFTWVTEMTKRLRGIVGTIVKYKGRKSGPPKWFEQVGLPIGKGQTDGVDDDDDSEDDGEGEVEGDEQFDMDEDMEGGEEEQGEPDEEVEEEGGGHARER